MGDVQRMPDDDRDGRLSMGMALFLASWAMMFGGLVLAYGILRSDAAVWPPPGAPPIPLGLPLVATAVLAASTFTMEKSVRVVRSAHRAELFRWLLASLILGSAFLTLQSITWVGLWNEGLRPAGTYGGTFYVITGFHAVHVLVGVGLLGLLLRGAARGRYTARDLAPLRMTALYWHFLGVSWLVILAGVYLA